METAKGSFSLEVMDPDNISGWKDEDPYFGSEKRGKNIILYDWFAMTSKVDSVESLLNQLGLKTSLPFKETKYLFNRIYRTFFSKAIHKYRLRFFSLIPIFANVSCQ